MPLHATESGYIALLQDIEADNPTGDIYVITDNRSLHNSAETRAWLAEHSRIHHIFIPKGACRLNLQEGWWRLFRRDAPFWTEFCQPRRDRAGHSRRYSSAQPASQPLALGTSPQGSSLLPSPLFLSPLRNAALVCIAKWRGQPGKSFESK